MNNICSLLRRWLAPTLLGLALVVLTGCGAKPYPVSGKLLFEDGKPITELAGFNVSFTSQKLTKSATGVIGPDGTFKLTTVHPNDGAFPGDYDVILSQPHPNPERNEKRQPVIDFAYEDIQRSGLKATVEPKENEFTFKLRRFDLKKQQEYERKKQQQQIRD
jgi:hypothetical protein